MDPFYSFIFTPNKTQPLDLTQHEMNKIKLSLNNAELWNQFHHLTSEMVITRSGRHMFPKLELAVSGLELKKKYFVVLQFRLVSNQRQKFCADVVTGAEYWTEFGMASAELYSNFYTYSNSPLKGAYLMDQLINFKNVKLTNNQEMDHNCVMLQSMHKYIPRIWVVEFDESNYFGLNPNFKHIFFHSKKRCFEFKNTEFIAVTAYQNNQVTKLKINNNPFAKGFRALVEKRKRKKEKDETIDSNQGTKYDELMESNVEEEFNDIKRIRYGDKNNHQTFFRPWISSCHKMSF